MSAAAPWSVKGIDPKAREIAKDLARRSGMTLGEWLNSMIMEDEDEGYATLPRRASNATESFDRRGRARRLDDAYETNDEGWQRISASIDVIAARLEAAERRSTVAIQGVDQAVAGLVRRLDHQDAQSKAQARRLDDVTEELREGHRRLRRFEQEVAPRTDDSFAKVEQSIGSLASRLYDMEERQRTGLGELRQKMDAAEKAAGPGPGTELLAQVGERLDQAQSRTSEALSGLERSFAELDRRMREAEGRIAPEGQREAARFEKLAETLSRQVEANRSEMMRRLEATEAENRIDRLAHTVQSVADQVRNAEEKGARAVEAMGREVLRIAQNLNGRMQTVEAQDVGRAEALARNLASKLDQDFARHNDRIDQKLSAIEDRNALALEKLGSEITRISDRLSERIAQSERRSQQALDDIARRMTENSDRFEQRYDRASGELSERMRQSEERTARLLAEARESIERRQAAPARERPLDEPDLTSPPVPAFDTRPSAQALSERMAADPVLSAPAWPEPSRQPLPTSSDADVDLDWRANAFPDVAFEDDWSDDPVIQDAALAAPFPTTQSAPEPVTVTAPAAPLASDPAPVTEPVIQPFSSFGGADVNDVLEATEMASPHLAPDAFDAGDIGYAAETDFVDPRQVRAGMIAGAAAGRASSRSTVDAARAAMIEAEDDTSRKGFGLKPRKGGKSKLQERLDKQANRDGSPVRKAFMASVMGVFATGIGVYALGRLNDGPLPDLDLPGLDGGVPPKMSEATLPLAASALVPPADAGTPTASADTPASRAYDQAVEQLRVGNPEGVDALRRAADMNFAPAQAHLASLLQNGDHGVTVNPGESRRWARRAAEGGDAEGMHFYAMQLYDGVGGAQNQAEALVWLQRAAERGLVNSQFNVARLYEKGARGVAVNPTEALKWYMIAARRGDQQAEEELQRLTPTASAASRRAARAAADAFLAQAPAQG